MKRLDFETPIKWENVINEFGMFIDDW